MHESCLVLNVGDDVSADNVIGVTGIEDGAIRGPAERDALSGESLLADGALGELDGVKADLGLEIPDVDGGGSSSTEPVTDGGEDEVVDDLTSLKGVEVLALVDVPEHGGTVLTTGGTERAIGGDSDGVDITGVTDKGVAEVEVLHVPDLNNVVPTSRNEGRGIGVGGEADAGDPLLVTVVVQGVLAATKGVPDLDGLIARAGDNLAVVSGESDREDILGVTGETNVALAVLDVPETERTIPRAGEGIEVLGVVNGDSKILNEVVVAGEALEGNSEGVGGLIALDLPDDDGLIARSGNDVVGVVDVGSDGGDPTVMALKLTLENKLLGRHLHRKT